jgi:hypothetical protein
MNYMKKFLTLLLGVALLLPAGSALAATMTSGEEVRLNSQDTVSGNYYAVGGITALSGTIEGDAYVAGGMVNIIGDTRDDLVVVGGNVTVSGNVGQDVRVIGGNVVVSGNVGGEAIAAGGTVQLIGNEVMGDVGLAGGLVTVDGKVNGNVKIAGEEVLINGEVMGNVEVTDAERLRIGDSANIHGTVFYKGRKEAEVAEGARLANSIQFEKMMGEGRMKNADKVTVIKAIFGFITIAFFIKLIILIVTALILLAVLPKCTEAVVHATQKDYWRNTLYGLVIAIVAPILTILLFITILGSMAAIVVGLAFGILMVLAKLVAMIFIGTWIIRLFNKKRDVKLDWKPVVVGALAVTILSIIPVVGWIVLLLVFLAAFGALSMHSYQTIIKKQ